MARSRDRRAYISHYHLQLKGDDNTKKSKKAPSPPLFWGVYKPLIIPNTLTVSIPCCTDAIACILPIVWTREDSFNFVLRCTLLI